MQQRFVDVYFALVSDENSLWLQSSLKFLPRFMNIIQSNDLVSWLETTFNSRGIPHMFLFNRDHLNVYCGHLNEFEKAEEVMTELGLESELFWWYIKSTQTKHYKCKEEYS